MILWGTCYRFPTNWDTRQTTSRGFFSLLANDHKVNIHLLAILTIKSSEKKWHQPTVEMIECDHKNVVRGEVETHPLPTHTHITDSLFSPRRSPSPTFTCLLACLAPSMQRGSMSISLWFISVIVMVSVLTWSPMATDE